jgi:putative ABC transport system permease protein
LLLSSFKPLNVLRGINVLKIKNSTLRKTLVTVQFTIAVSLSICAIVILKQLAFIQQSNEGYDRKQIFSFSIPGSFINTHMAADKSGMIKLVKNELLKETAIEHVTASTDDIQQITMSMSGIADWVGRKKDEDPGITLLSVDPDFRDIFKLQLKEGRWFTDNSADQHNYMLSETTVSQLGLKKPYLGQYFAILQDTGRIIGIVKDFHFESFHQKITAAVLCARPDMKGTLFIQANTTKMKAALAKAETVFRKFFPQSPFEYKFMDATFENMYRADTKTATLVSAFSGIAIFISCLGLFGLVSFTAEQRTKEIGIRKILGATVINLTTLLSKDFVKLVIIAIIIASPIAWWAMNKWLEAFAYKINISWWMFGVTGIAALFIALTTVCVQAVKAAMANPVKSLRTE